MAATKASPPRTNTRPAALRRNAAPQLRLLPVTIVVAAAMLMVRVNDIWTSVATLKMPHIAINQSEAQQPPPPGGAQKNVPPPAQPVGVPPAGQAAPAAQGASAGGKQAGQAAATTTAPPAVPAAGTGEGEPPTFTQNEVDVLQKLSERRDALDAREKDLALRENLVKAAEDRIDKKIAEMKAVQANVQAMLKQIDDQDQAKLKSLVKIYENMQPKDAARIFEQLEMPILLGVVENMKEQKVAPIMEAMDPAKAKSLTDAIAQRRAAKTEGQPTGG